MKNMISAGALAIAALAMPMTADAATLIGEGTFATAGDLTIIDTGTARLEFLDLYLTTNFTTVTDAINSVAGGGFSWATVAEVSALLDAFGLPLPPADATTWSAESPAALSSAVLAFQSALGETLAGYSVGFLDDGVADGQTALINVRAAGESDVFRNHVDFGSGYSGGNRNNVGYFLVREVAPVPLPAAGFVMLAALGMLAGVRRTKNS